MTMTVFPTYIMHKGAKFCHLKIKKKKYSTFDNNSSTTFFFPPSNWRGNEELHTDGDNHSFT